MTELEAPIGGLDQGTGPVRRVDGEAVTPEQGPPVAEGHPFERVEDVPGDEVLEAVLHAGVPSIVRSRLPEPCDTQVGPLLHAPKAEGWTSGS